MPARIYMMKGLPACGKTTKAKQMLEEFGSGNAKRVSKDDLRAMLDNGKWSKHNEKFVLSIRDLIVSMALEFGKHVIVDDTNLAPRHEERLRQLAKENGYEFAVVDMTDVPLEECIQRDRKRPNYVGEQVIRGMWYQFLSPSGTVEYDPFLPSCVICDIDGTLADLNGRNPYDASTCYEDKPREVVKDIVQRFHENMPIVLVSGRSEEHNPMTWKWIREKCGISEFSLYMRKAGDTRRDSIIKREIYERHIAGKYNVYAIIDDRPSVIRECWQALGFSDRIINVGDGREF